MQGRECTKLLAPLVRALRRLEDGQGRIARRNARSAVAAAVRNLKGSVDRAFPSIRLPSKPGKRRAPLEIRRRRLVNAGWSLVSGFRILAKIAAAGIRVRRLNGDEMWAPQWAVIIAERYPYKLAAAARDTMVRRAVLNDAALATQTLAP